MHEHDRVHRLTPYGVALLILAALASSLRAEATSPPDLPRLIRQLGAAEFAAREGAESSLRQMGLTAYSALAEAAQHEDLEIRLRARAILVDLREQHLLAGLDPAVSRIMQNYASLPLDVRRERVERLTAILPQQGVELLARLTQFEEDQTLAESAVTALLMCRLPDSLDRQRELAEPVLQGVRDASSRPARWLRAWALMIQAAPDATDTWKSLLDDWKRAEPAWPTRDPEREFALRRCYLESLIRAGRTEEADTFTKETAAWVHNHQDLLLPWLSWLVDRDQSQAVLDFQQQYPDSLANDPRLLYLLAEATEAVDPPATQRFQAAFDAGTPDATGTLTAYWLNKERGRIDWAEREYRRVLDESEMTSSQHVNVRFILAEMLHDVGRDDAAADILDELLSAAKDSKQIQQALSLSVRDLNGYVARMHLFRGLHAREQGDEAACVRELELGLAQDPTEIDLLIARFRTPNPTPAFRDQTKRAIANARQSHEQLIKAIRQQITRTGPNGGLSDENLAQALNDYAWLVANTEGDQRHALDCSRESLLLEPGTFAFLDTLGRCYYAVGDLPRAIQFQQWAVERGPHEHQIVRQFEFFQKSLAETTKTMP